MTEKGRRKKGKGRTLNTETREAVSIAKHLLDKLGSYPELGGDAT